MNNTFEYLGQWSKERLQKRYQYLKPLVEHLVQMFNAEYKMNVMQLGYISDKTRTEHVEILFSTESNSENSWPEQLTNFLHDYTTYLCAEKLAIEAVINRIS
jgi:hypothetical protein